MHFTKHEEQIPVAELDTIDFSLLEAGDPVTETSLKQAATTIGFFYLDLRQSSIGKTINGLIENFANNVALGYFSQDQTIKDMDFCKDIDRGYKEALDEKNVFSHESFEISTDELLQETITLPEPFLQESKALVELVEGCDLVTRTITERLLTKLGSLEVLNSEEIRAKSSASGFKFISAPLYPLHDQHPDTTHTDGGLVTLLWCDQLTSQVLEPTNKEWMWITPPADGCTLVNVADSLQRLSDSRLRSPVHRVVQPYDGEGPRLFLSYYLRPGVPST